MKAQAEWPIAFFDDDYLRIYRPMFSEEATGREVDFIESALGVPRGAKVLDLACGIGRHAIGMASRGYQVSGLDFSERYLEIAAGESAKAKVEVEWVAGDMRELEFDAEFDAVYSYFTSFGYFSDAENEKVLAHIARSLKPGGRFLLDMANRDWILTRPAQRTWNQREDGALLMEEATLDLSTSRVITRQTLIEPEGGSRVTKEFNLRVYTCGELRALMARNGLNVQGVWGGPDRSAYSADTRRLIMLARRGGGREEQA